MIVYFAVEDRLSESVLRKLITETHIGMDLTLKPLDASRGGYGALRKNLEKYCNLSTRSKVVVLTDLDQAECAPSLLNSWFEEMDIPDGLTFRISIREVESWLLADRDGFSEFLGVPSGRIPKDVDTLDNPKSFLISLAGRATKKDVKSDLLPQRGKTAKVGLGYNNTLCRFVENEWNIRLAADNSPSLDKAYRRISEIRP